MVKVNFFFPFCHKMIVLPLEVWTKGGCKTHNSNMKSKLYSFSYLHTLPKAKPCAYHGTCGYIVVYYVSPWD